METLQLLLEAGADVDGGARQDLTFAEQLNPAAPQNVTPLMVAAFSGQKQAVRWGR